MVITPLETGSLIKEPGYGAFAALWDSTAEQMPSGELPNQIMFC